MQSTMNRQAIELDAATNPLATRRRRYARDAAFRGRRGSAIILVIVSIVLLAILGATMVQVARFERLSETQNNIDVVVASVLDLIAIRLGEDLTDDNDHFFNPGGTAATGGFDEPYDYPWTRQDTAGQFQAELIDGSTVVVWGGAFDDMWLASTGLNTAGNRWPHITNLTGLFLDAGGNADLSTQAAPNERLVNAANIDSNVLLTNAALVDADGDGIGDSKWAWAPIRQIGGTRYVMAVRIIDLSSRVDLNVALGQVHATPAAPNLAEGIARGDGPTELDGMSAAIALGNNAGVIPTTSRNEWDTTIGYRFVASATPAGAVVPYGDRMTPLRRQHYGFLGAAQVNNSFGRSATATGGTYDYTQTYGQSSAFALLFNGGLASSSGSTIETHMSTLLRGGANESTFSDFQGSTEQQYFANNPRLNFSPFTGAGIFARPAAANSSTFAAMGAQIDVNKAEPVDLSTAIQDIFVGNYATLLATFPHLADATRFSDQLAANLKDYSDEDNWVTTAGTQFGFEALPIITEVYAEREYNLTSSTDTSGSGTGPWNAQWDQNGSGISYMIEITNPYHRPISLVDVQLMINGTAVTNSGIGDLANLFLPAQNELQPGETVIVYHDGALSGSPSMSTAIDPGHTGPAPSAVNDVWTGAAGNIRVTLHAKQDTTADAFNTTATAPVWMTEPYQAVETIGMPGTHLQTGITSDPSLGPGNGVLQVSAQGNGNGLNALHVTPAEFFTSADANKLEPSATAIGTAPGNDAIGSTSKAGGKADIPNFDAQQIVHQDRPMKYIGDLLQVPVFGFEAGVTKAEQLENSGVVIAGPRVLENLMLPYRAAAPKVNAASPTLNYPHSVILMERLTVASPLEDGQDNDNNGTIDDESEFLIPGRINVNTASEALLQRVLPFPDQATRDLVAARIVARREQANKASSGVNMGDDNSRGIAYMGELYDQIRNQILPATPGNTRTLGGHIDWNDYEVSPATGHADEYTVDGTTYFGDTIGQDREEEIMLAKWLNEVGSTRSDIFAAYIIVQGYPAGDFQGGAIESAKLIALFSRTNIRGGGQKAQVLGVLRIE